MDTLSLLRAGRERIARGWCAGSQGLDRNGDYRDPWDGDAVRWCALGALNAQIGVYGNADTAIAYKALAKALPRGYFGDDQLLPANAIANFNNSHNQAAVLALFDRAIAALRPAKRTDAELVADLMQRIGKQAIPDGEIASPEYARA